MQKKKSTQPNKPAEKKDEDRETKILNVLCNTSILLITLMTEAFSEMFTNISKEMMTSVATGLGAPEEATKNIDALHQQLPDHLRKELITMKKDLTRQLMEKRAELSPILANPIFDQGVTIVERTSLPLPLLTQDLDEHSLLGYLALLQTDDPQATTMLKELLEWMNTLPQPEKKEK
jgi:hypothetical protein